MALFRALLPSLTARLAPGVEVRGATCDLGGAAGGLALRTVDGQETQVNPFGLTIDYCLTKMSVDAYLEAAPVQ